MHERLLRNIVTSASVWMNIKNKRWKIEKEMKRWHKTMFYPGCQSNWHLLRHHRPSEWKTNKLLPEDWSLYSQSHWFFQLDHIIPITWAKIQLKSNNNLNLKNSVKKSLGNNLDRNLNWSHCAALHLLDWTQFEGWSFSVDEMNKLLKNLVKHFQGWESMLRNWMSSMLHKIPVLQYVTLCNSMLHYVTVCYSMYVTVCNSMLDQIPE